MEEIYDDENKADATKIFKISYSINMLPMLDLYVKNDE